MAEVLDAKNQNTQGSTEINFVKTSIRPKFRDFFMFFAFKQQKNFHFWLQIFFFSRKKILKETYIPFRRVRNFFLFENLGNYSSLNTFNIIQSKINMRLCCFFGFHEIR